MGLDRNTIIGFVLLGVLLFVYLFTSTKATHELEAQRKHEADSIAVVSKTREAAARDAAMKKDSVAKAGTVVDTLKGFEKAANGAPQLVTVENDLLKIVFSNKGGQPVDVELKKFKSYDSTPVRLVGPECRISYPINTGTGAADIADLYFEAGQVVRNPD